MQIKEFLTTGKVSALAPLPADKVAKEGAGPSKAQEEALQFMLVYELEEQDVQDIVLSVPSEHAR
eukprot:1160579-Pelagomonas_calceolata.AAC.5